MMNSVARPRRLLLALHLASVALVTVQQAVLGRSNNFRVFRSASLNLFAGRDLYAAHPEQHFDFYKYSPTFALLFAPLAYLPFALAFLCWSLLNGLLLWYALDRLLPERPATLALTPFVPRGAVDIAVRAEQHARGAAADPRVCRVRRPPSAG